MLGFFSLISRGKAKSGKLARLHQRPRARLGVEELTPRVLPSAGWFDLASGHLLGHGNHTLASTSSNANGTIDYSQTNSAARHDCGSGATLAGNLTNSSGATGSASFNATTGALKVQVTGAAANSSLAVMVDGATMGTFNTNASGNGQAKLANVSVQAGSTIMIGDLQGTFTQANLMASLTGSTGVTGSASFNTLKDKLRVSITGAAASTTYNVTVNNVVVGQITTNGSGAGRLKLKQPGVTIQSGSTVAVSDTLGDPAILQATFA